MQSVLTREYGTAIDGSPGLWKSAGVSGLPILRPQEIPLDDPDSCNMFRPAPDKPFVATPSAIELYGRDVILKCLRVLQDAANEHDGLDYLQVFQDTMKPENLWFIEDGAGGAITALLPSDY